MPIMLLKYAPGLSLARWECLWHLAARPAGGPFERLDRPCLVDVDQRVELVGQAGIEVVADTLGLRAIDHADSPLQLPVAQPFDRRAAITQAQQKARNTAGMEQRLVAAGQRVAHALALWRRIPIRGRRDGAAVGAEAYERRRAAI